MSQFNSFFLPYQVPEESECDICGIFILESNNIASYNNNYRPRTDPPQTFKNVYASGFSLSRYHYSERTQSPPASQPATFLFRVTFGAKRKLIHHTVTVTDGTFLFLFLFCFSHLASSAWGIMRLRILVEKKLWSLSLSPLSSARSTDVQGRKPKRDGINMRAPCARMCCSGPSASSMLEYLSRLRCLHHYWRPCFEMVSGTDSCFRPSSYKCIVHTVSIEARIHVGAT